MTAHRAPVRVLVVGGGFAGVYAASYLGAADLPNRDVEVTLVSERNYFTFTPLLAEVAGGSLSPQHVTLPLRVLGKNRGFGFVLGRVDEVDADAGAARGEGLEPLRFDYCILATGAQASFFGNDRLAERALPMTSVADAVRLRNRVLSNAERAVATRDAATRQRLLTWVVAGGGPAGVEVASEIRELLRRVLPRYYPFDDAPRVVLVQADDGLLRGWDPALARRGLGVLRDRGVEVRLESRVEGCEDGEVAIAGEEETSTVDSENLVWTVGTVPRSRELSLPPGDGSGGGEDGRGRESATSDRGHLLVDEHLRVPGRDGLWAAGDSVELEDPRKGRPYPAVAPIAISQGIRAAGNVENRIAGRDPEPYRAHHAGKIVSLGGGAALVDVLGYHVTGTPAWLIYRTAYLLKMVGTKNKVRAGLALALNRVFERDLACLSLE